MDRHVCQRDVTEGDQWVCITRHEGVEKAARATATWLTLLLRANVNSPPERAIYYNVFVVDVSGLAARAGEH